MLPVTNVTQHKRKCAVCNHDHNSLLVEIGTNQIDTP